MRIIQVVESLHLGGLEVMVLELARRQKCHGHDVRIYCLYEGGKLQPDAEASGIPVTVFGKTPGYSPKLLAGLVRALTRDRPDVVHSHNPAIHPYTALACSIAGVHPVINTRHGPLTSDGREYRHWHYRIVEPLTDRVVFVSAHCRTALANKLRIPSSKCRVIVNGVETSRFAKPHRESNGTFTFGTVGRMVPMKGHEVLVRAFASVANEMPDSRLRIVGGGPGMQGLTDLVDRLSLGGRVSIEAQNSDIPGVLAELDVFVISSLSEGLPLAILEAMAAGLPIISTRVGGIPEVLPEGEGIWLCESDDEKALGMAMLRAYNKRPGSEDRSRISSFARERYDLEVMFQQYQSLYQEAMATN